MLVSSVNSNLSFTRALNSKELKEFKAIRDKGKQLAGQTGQSIFIVPDTCLPQTAGTNTGVGNLSSNSAQEFFNYMKDYLGFNRVEVLPQGELHSNNGLYSPYSSTALSLGNHQINLELLMQDDFNKILLPEEYKEVVDSNTSPNKDTIVNHKNVTEEYSAQEKALRKAYTRFKNLNEQTQLKKDFKNYVMENSDWLEPKAIYKILSKKYGTNDYEYWHGIDPYLYESAIKPEERTERITQILKENPDEAEYYKFKQFMADKHLAIGKKKLNDMGIKLTGDCEINFSKDEIWADPAAFNRNRFIGEKDWGIISLDYSTIKDPSSASAQMLKKKVELCAKRYDAIRFDVGWAYLKPKLHHYAGGFETQYLGDSVLKFIEQTVKDIKGNDYDLNNLIYEFQGGEIFKSDYQSGAVFKTGRLLNEAAERVGVYDTAFMHDTPYDIWGSNDAFLKRGWSPDKFVVGVGNHDTQPLRQIANNIRDDAITGGDRYHRNGAIKPLADILKLDPKKLSNPIEYAKAKWAEPMMAKNNMMFYMDVFGREERFNMHGQNTTVHPEKNFAYKIPENYKEAYHKAIQEGYGFNIMDSLEKVFKAKGLDKTEPKLYKKIVKFRDILYDNGAPKNSSKYTKAIIIAGVAAAATGMVIYSFISRSKKQTQNNEKIQTTENSIPQTPKAEVRQNTAPAGINFNDFLNATKAKSV